MFTAVIAAAILLASANGSDPTPSAPALTITDITLNDKTLAQPPANATILPVVTRSQAYGDVHIKPIDPAADVEGKLLEIGSGG